MALFRCGGGAAEDTYVIGYAAISQGTSKSFTTSRAYKKFRVAWGNSAGEITINGTTYNSGTGTKLYEEGTTPHVLYEEFNVPIASGETVVFKYTGGGAIPAWIFGIA